MDGFEHATYGISTPSQSGQTLLRQTPRTVAPGITGESDNCQISNTMMVMLAAGVLARKLMLSNVGSPDVQRQAKMWLPP